MKQLTRRRLVDRKIVELLVAGKSSRFIKRHLNVGSGRFEKVTALAAEHGYPTGRALPALYQSGLQRVSQHPAKDVIDLTPRVWKTKFAHDPMRSDIALADQ